MSTNSREHVKEIFDGAYLQAVQDDAEDAELDGAVAVAAAAWQEGWNQGFRDYQSAVTDDDGYLVITPTKNPHENALVTDERTEK